MAARRPLVQVNGVIGEFVDTDTLVGAGGSTLSGSFSISNGELSVDAIAGTSLPTVSSNLVAAGGVSGTQSNALQLLIGYSFVGTVTSGDGVKLPTSVIAGDECIVVNNGSSTLKVYPNLGKQINSISVNSPIEVVAGNYAIFTSNSALNWESAMSSAGSPTIKTVNSTSLLGSGDIVLQTPLVSGTSIKTVNSASILGSGDIVVQPTLVSGTNIRTVNGNTLLGSTDISVQPTLVSGTSIKTVNSASILGSGDIVVQTPLVSGTSIKTVNSTSLLGSGDIAVQTPLVSGTSIKTVNGNSLLGYGDIAISGGGSGTVITSGSATIDFGSGSGTNLVSTTVTGQTGLGLGSIVKAWVSYSSTASHNAIEHLVTPIKIGVDTLVVNTGFKITAFSEFTLTGTFNVNWEWY